MSDLRALYQELILDHSARPRHFAAMSRPDRVAHGVNPLCGDEIILYLKIDHGRILDASFQGSGCAIAKASASLLTDSLRGASEGEARQLFERFHALVTGKAGAQETELGKLAVFGGIANFPARIKCATLAWHALIAALDGKNAPVSTEAGFAEEPPS
jgi:nitrogen fixation protein NifU and related proteins